MDIQALIKQRKQITDKNEELRTEINGCKTSIGRNRSEIEKRIKKMRELEAEMSKNLAEFEKLGKVLFTINQL